MKEKTTLPQPWRSYSLFSLWCPEISRLLTLIDHTLHEALSLDSSTLFSQGDFVIPALQVRKLRIREDKLFIYQLYPFLLFIPFNKNLSIICFLPGTFMAFFQLIREGDRVLQVLHIGFIHLHSIYYVPSLCQLLDYIPGITLMDTECPWEVFLFMVCCS